VPGCQKLQMMA